MYTFVLVDNILTCFSKAQSSAFVFNFRAVASEEYAVLVATQRLFQLQRLALCTVEKPTLFLAHDLNYYRAWRLFP
jgi:hypothetical protein